jgi:hypothetical protein
MQRQAFTRFNEKSKVLGFAWEIVAGYGTRLLRVLGIAFALFVILVLWFWYRVGLTDSIILSAGAFLTFGAKIELLDSLSVFDRLLYVLAAFIGVSSVALFITVLAGLLLKEN